MSDQQQDLKAISREWMAARIVLIIGFALTIGAGSYFAWEARQAVMANRHQVLSEVQQVQAQENAQEAEIKGGEQICRTALKNAQDFGIIPPFGKLASEEPQKSDVKGRYVCIAVSQVSKYTIAADLYCRNFTSAQCVNLYSITQDDGTVLFKRQG